jgi:hypothetical protein
MLGRWSAATGRIADNYGRARFAAFYVAKQNMHADLV